MPQSSTTATVGSGFLTISRMWDGSIQQTTVPAGIWVLRHGLTRLKKVNPSDCDQEHLIKGVFWSKESARAYVEREYGYGADAWIEGDPDGGYDFIISEDENAQLTLDLIRTELFPALP